MQTTSERAEGAKRILESEVFKAAHAEAAQRLIDRWTLSDNADEREALWHRYQALDALPEQLRVYVGRAAHEERNTK